MNVEIGAEAAQFPEKEYINGIFVQVHQKLDLQLQGQPSWMESLLSKGKQSDHSLINLDCNNKPHIRTNCTVIANLTAKHSAKHNSIGQ